MRLMTRRAMSGRPCSEVCCAWSQRFAAELEVQAVTESAWTATGGVTAAGAREPTISSSPSGAGAGAAAGSEAGVAAAVGAAAGAGVAAVVAAAGVGADASASAASVAIASIASIAKGEVVFVQNMVLPFWVGSATYVF